MPTWGTGPPLGRGGRADSVRTVHEFGLTGGIGSGKSSVSKRLVERGAGLVDADATVKRLQRRGEAVFDAIVAHFGAAIVGPDGELDRAAIASVVFNDADQLEALNEMVHPAVRRDMAGQRAKLAETHRVIILDIPLLLESDRGHEGLSGVIVVDVPTEIAVERLVRHRGFTAEDAEARIRSQVSRQDRLDAADFIIDNSGSLDDLDREVERC